MLVSISFFLLSIMKKRTMKKCIIIATMAIAMASCGNKTGNNNDSPNDSTATATDSLKVAKAEDNSKEGYESPDYAVMCLYGKVKSIKEKVYIDGEELDGQSITYLFDSKGMMTQGKMFEIPIGNGEKTKIERNAKGMPVKIELYGADWDCWFETTISYNDKNQAIAIASEVPDGGRNTDIIYDGEGQIAKIVELWSGEGTAEQMTSTYKAVKKDAHGNWTDMTRIRAYDDGESPDETFRITRVIEYY